MPIAATGSPLLAGGEPARHGAKVGGCSGPGSGLIRCSHRSPAGCQMSATPRAMNPPSTASVTPVM